jgi:hypothetical protein
MTQPEVFVFVALAVGWAAIGAWTLRIARMVNRLSDAAEERVDSQRGA